MDQGRTTEHFPQISDLYKPYQLLFTMLEKWKQYKRPHTKEVVLNFNVQKNDPMSLIINKTLGPGPRDGDSRGVRADG